MSHVSASWRTSWTTCIPTISTPRSSSRTSARALPTSKGSSSGLRSPRPEARLYDYINELAALGLPQDASYALHRIRKAANLGKHDATSTLTLKEVRRLVEDARRAVAEIGVRGSAPGSDTPEGSTPPRTFTVVLADYPTGGEVDYEICTLLDDGRVVTLDHFQLRSRTRSQWPLPLRPQGGSIATRQRSPCRGSVCPLRAHRSYRGSGNTRVAFATSFERSPPTSTPRPSLTSSAPTVARPFGQRRRWRSLISACRLRRLQSGSSESWTSTMR